MALARWDGESISLVEGGQWKMRRAGVKSDRSEPKTQQLLTARL
jgi:hypothetical protein